MFDEQMSTVLLNKGPRCLEPIVVHIDNEELFTAITAEAIENITGLQKMHQPAFPTFHKEDFKDRRIIWSYGCVQAHELLKFVDHNAFLEMVSANNLLQMYQKLSPALFAMIPLAKYFHSLPRDKRPKP